MSLNIVLRYLDDIICKSLINPHFHPKDSWESSINCFELESTDDPKKESALQEVVDYSLSKEL